MTTFNLFFDGLPQELQTLVYEYDTTHRIQDKDQFAMSIKCQCLYNQIKENRPYCKVIKTVIAKYMQYHYDDWIMEGIAEGEWMDDKTLRSSGAYYNSYGYFSTNYYEYDTDFMQNVQDKIPFYVTHTRYDLIISPPFNGVLYFKFLPKGTIERVSNDDPILQAPYDGCIFSTNVLNAKLETLNSYLTVWKSNLFGYNNENFKLVLETDLGENNEFAIMQLVDETCNDLWRWDGVYG